MISAAIRMYCEISLKNRPKRPLIILALHCVLQCPIKPRVIFTTRSKLTTILSFNNFRKNYWSSNDNNCQQYIRKISQFPTLFTDTHITHTCSLITCNHHFGQHLPSCLIPLDNKSWTRKKKVSCGTHLCGVVHKRLPQNVPKLRKSHLALPTWLYITPLIWPKKNPFSPSSVL